METAAKKTEQTGEGEDGGEEGGPAEQEEKVHDTLLLSTMKIQPRFLTFTICQVIFTELPLKKNLKCPSVSFFSFVFVQNFETKCTNSKLAQLNIHHLHVLCIVCLFLLNAVLSVRKTMWTRTTPEQRWVLNVKI